MIVQSVLKIWDHVYTSNRNTVYTTLEDPVTHKKVIEMAQYLYDDKAEIQPVNTKGTKVDTRT